MTDETLESLLRAESVYFETGGGGKVFSVGSITFLGRLCHGDWQSPVFKQRENLVRRLSRSVTCGVRGRPPVVFPAIFTPR